VRAVAQANLNQPRYATTREPTGVDRGCRTPADWVKATTAGEATAKGTLPVHRGPGDGTHEQMLRVKWGTSAVPPARVGGLDNKSISCRVDGRGSDEVIVSVDPAGHDNPLASQGPLDRIASGIFLFSFPPRGGLDRQVHYKGKTSEALAAYKSVRFTGSPAKVTAEFLFEAVLGKTRRTEF
jgi:hypothetical protein